MRGVERLVYEALREAAERGEPCPLNKEIAAKLGVPEGTVDSSVNRLRYVGRISSRNAPGVRRVVTIIETGKSTSADPSSRINTSHDSIIYEALCEAAQLGLPCPNNVDLMRRSQCRGERQVRKAMARLAAAGQITVELTSHRRRVVTITATGHSTRAPCDDPPAPVIPRRKKPPVTVSEPAVEWPDYGAQDHDPGDGCYRIPNPATWVPRGDNM